MKLIVCNEAIKHQFSGDSFILISLISNIPASNLLSTVKGERNIDLKSTNQDLPYGRNFNVFTTI